MSEENDQAPATDKQHAEVNKRIAEADAEPKGLPTSDRFHTEKTHADHAHGGGAKKPD
jgi:hypothetical protein